MTLSPRHRAGRIKEREIFNVALPALNTRSEVACIFLKPTELFSMNQPKILAFAGSTRAASFNKKLIKFAVQSAQSSGAAITVIDLRDLPMPLYDGDLEEASGLP